MADTNEGKAFEVDELDDAALDSVSGGDDNFKCTINSVAGCGAPLPGDSVEPVGAT